MRLAVLAALLLAWRGLAWGLRRALQQPEATLRDGLKGVLWDVALALLVVALVQLAGSARLGRAVRGGLSALGFAAMLIRAADTATCYLVHAHFSADNFLYVDPGWLVRLREPAPLGLVVVALLAAVAAAAVVWRMPVVVKSQRATIAWLVACLPGLWVVRDATLYPPAVHELRLVPEFNFFHQLAVWQDAARLGAPPQLTPELARKLQAVGLLQQPFNPDYPLLRQGFGEHALPLAPGATTDPPNVVITLVEGGNARLVSALSGEFAGVMPQLSALAGRMTQIRGFVATASPTIAGVITHLCGVHPPSHPRDLAPGQTVDNNTAYTCLPDLLRQRGYRTVFVQTTSKRVMGLEFFLRTHGVDEVHALDEFAARYPNRPAGAWGMHDDALVDYAQEQIARLEGLRRTDHRPYFLLMLTLDSHDPGMAPPGFALPDAVTSVRDDGIARQLAAGYHFTDAALGQLGRFLLAPDRAAQTLWLVSADHAQFETPASRALFGLKTPQFDEVPWLVHDPRHVLPPVMHVVAGSTDTAPTLLHLLQTPTTAPQPHSMTGYSAFGRRVEFAVLAGRIGSRFAFLAKGPARREWPTGEVRRRCDGGLALFDRAPLTACELTQWLDWQDGLWQSKRLFPRAMYQGDRGLDRGLLLERVER